MGPSKGPLIEDRRGADFDYVGSRLKLFARTWRGATKWAKSTVSKGLVWHWKNIPPIELPCTTQTDPNLAPLVKDLLNKKVITEVKNQKCFISKIFPVATQARWIKAHNTKPKTSEQNDCDTKISHDKSLSSEKSIGQKRLAHKDRYKRCLSAYSGEGTTAKVSGIQLRKPAILLQR